MRSRDLELVEQILPQVFMIPNFGVKFEQPVNLKLIVGPEAFGIPREGW